MIEHRCTEVGGLGEELLEKVWADGGFVVVGGGDVTVVLVHDDMRILLCEAEGVFRGGVTISEQGITPVLDTVFGKLIQIYLDLPMEIYLVGLGRYENGVVLLETFKSFESFRHLE